MVNGKEFVFAGRKKRHLKESFRIGQLNDWRSGRMFGKGENGGGDWMIVERNSSAEGGSIIAEDNFDGLRRAAGWNRQIRLQKVGGAGSGGLHVKHAVGIDFNTVCAGRDILKFKRGRTALADLLGAVAGLEHPRGMRDKLNVGGKIVFLLGESFRAGSRGDDAHADGNVRVG